MAKKSSKQDGKKVDAKKASRKVILQSPWNFGVPDASQCFDHQEEVVEHFNQLIKAMGYTEWESRTKSELRRLDNAAKLLFKKSKRTLRCMLAVGFNEVMRGLQKKILSVVIAPIKSSPPHLLEALAVCCASCNAKVVLISDFSPLEKKLKVSGCFTIGIKVAPGRIKLDNLGSEIANMGNAHLDFVNKLTQIATTMPSNLPNQIDSA